MATRPRACACIFFGLMLYLLHNYSVSRQMILKQKGVEVINIIIWCVSIQCHVYMYNHGKGYFW